MEARRRNFWGILFGERQKSSVALHVRRIPLQQGPEAGMAAGGRTLVRLIRSRRLFRRRIVGRIRLTVTRSGAAAPPVPRSAHRSPSRPPRRIHPRIRTRGTRLCCRGASGSWPTLRRPRLHAAGSCSWTGWERSLAPSRSGIGDCPSGRRRLGSSSSRGARQRDSTRLRAFAVESPPFS